MKEDFGLHLPDDSWVCKDCGTEFFAEFGYKETPNCVECGSTNLKSIENRRK